MDERLPVSVIVPVFNCQRYLAEAIESIIAQDYRPLELIVVDDGSTDGSAEVARSYAPLAGYHYQPHSGIAAARNRGVEAAGGSFIAFLDADDLWCEGKLSRQVAVLRSRPALDMVFGHAVQFISPDVAGEGTTGSECSNQPLPGRSSGTALIRREVFLDVGPFDVKLRTGEFIDWYLRATESSHESLMLPDVMLRRRLHRANHGLQKRDSRVDYARVLKAALDRRRAASLRHPSTSGETGDARPTEDRIEGLAASSDGTGGSSAATGRGGV